MHSANSTDADSLPPEAYSAALYGVVALHYHRRNMAVGIERVTPQVALLLDCYKIHKRREQAAAYAALSPLEQARYTLNAAQRSAAALIEAARSSTDDAERVALLERAEALRDQVAEMVEMIKKLDGGQVDDSQAGED